MASNKRRKTPKDVPSKNSFAEIILTISYRFSLFSVLDDFLTMAIAACTQNLNTKKSYYEDEYLETIAKYKDSDLRFEFPKAFAALVVEMEDRFTSSSGNDVLGEFFEQYISNGKNGQFFTPYPVCLMMASMTHSKIEVPDNKEPLRIVDPTCGSGRMLIASHKAHGQGQEYYGIDIDRTCIKITALNLFLNGIFNSEVMCADALAPNDFVIAYRISFVPLGIFKIETKEDSRLWHLHHNAFVKKQSTSLGSTIVLDDTPFAERKKDNPTQLDLF